MDLMLGEADAAGEEEVGEEEYHEEEAGAGVERRSPSMERLENLYIIR